MADGRVFRPSTPPNELGCWMVSLLFILVVGGASYFLSNKPIGEAISVAGVGLIVSGYAISRYRSRDDEIRMDGEAIHQIRWGQPRSLRWNDTIAFGWLDRDGKTVAGLGDKWGGTIYLSGYMNQHELLNEIEQRSGLTFEESAPPEE